ncbi:pentapeptide repeat-containing protein [Rhodococcus sp. NPDC058521]|uniref:pentapeptide repeat-containing protein n=1 Tax=Rhodococcus sp. NPDC058521 TaxID=3346536 RepID=UPI00365AB388
MAASIAALGVTGAGISTAEPVRINDCTIVADPTPTEHTTCPGADLTHHDLRGINLRHANLEGADFRGTNVAAADFTGANLRSSDMSDTIATNANFTDADGTLVVLYRASFDVGGVLVGDFDITTGDHQEIAPELLEQMQEMQTPPPTTPQLATPQTAPPPPVGTPAPAPVSRP